MDKVTDIDLDNSLVPPAYMAWAMWDEGLRTASVEMLERILREHFGTAVLGGIERLTYHPMDGYQSVFSRILNEPLALSAPPAEVASVIWRQAPRDATLRSIFLGDYRWSEDPFTSDVNAVPQAETLIAILREHESAGLLSRDADDVPFGGRPVLTDELLAVADRQKLGRVYDIMSVPVSIPQSTGTWWEDAATSLPHLVLRTFIHDAFVKEDGRSGRPIETWHMMQSRHESYALAVVTAWRTLRNEISPEDWEKAARYIARSSRESLRNHLSHLLGN